MVTDCACDCECPELTEDGELCIACKHGQHTEDAGVRYNDRTWI
jgi:hypothetical protein